MSTLRKVKSLTQATIKSRPVGVDGLEWGLETVQSNGHVDFDVISDQRTDLTVNYDPTTKDYSILLADRSSDPSTFGAHGSVVTDTIQYSFSANNQNRTSLVIIEDITVYFQVHGQSPTGGQYVITLFIQSIVGESTKFKHEFWHHMGSQNAQT